MMSRTITKAVFCAALPHHEEFRRKQSLLGEVIGLSIDSRTLRAGEVFLAIRGDLDDGHRYINDVLAKGARLIIADSSHKADFTQVLPIIFVDDTLRLLGDLAREHLNSLPSTKIAVTGSNGKTTTKEMIKAALTHVVSPHEVYATAGNKNNLFGLPMCAFEVTTHHRYAIFEMGMNQIGEMKRLCSIVRPNVAVITNISGAHAGNFDDGILGIRREKGELLRSVAEGRGHAVINLDDEHIVHESTSMHFTSRTNFSSIKNADIRLIDMSPYALMVGAQSVRFLVDGNEFFVAVPLAGTHHAMNAACALAVIKALGLCVLKASQGIKDMTKITGRMSVSHTDDGALIINDGYNANPVSMKAGIIASHDFPSKRRIAAIGAMGELGDASSHLHFELGEMLGQHFDHVFLCGESAFFAVEGAEKAGMNKKNITFRNTSLELVESLQAILKPGDLLFVKGSLSSNMQALVNALTTRVNTSHHQ